MKVTGVVLAGGRGQRMGGADKGLQVLDGKPLVRYAIEKLSPQVDTLLISANRNLDAYREFGVPVISDTTPDFAGPLAGIQAALLATQTPWLVTAPCDSPDFPSDLVARLQAGVQAAQADLAVARTADGEQRAFCLLKHSLLPALTDYLAAGGRKIGDWLTQTGYCAVDFDQADAFRNINTCDELNARQAR